MVYEEIEVSKFYYGSTILLIGYKHEKFGYKFTTVSSSYTIDNQIVLGLGLDGDCFRQISKHINFSVNILGTDNMDMVFAGANNPSADRFALNPDIKYNIDNDYEVPLIEGVAAQFVCSMNEVFTLASNDMFVNVAADIKKRLFKSTVVKDGVVDKNKFDTLLFFADGHGEVIK